MVGPWTTTKRSSSVFCIFDLLEAMLGHNWYIIPHKVGRSLVWLSFCKCHTILYSAPFQQQPFHSYSYTGLKSSSQSHLGLMLYSPPVSPFLSPTVLKSRPRSGPAPAARVLGASCCCHQGRDNSTVIPGIFTLFPMKLAP